MNTLGSSANQTSNSFKTLGSSMGGLLSFYARWVSMSSAVNLIILQTKKAIDFTFEMDEKVRNISMISGEDRSVVQAKIKDWNALALEMKSTTGVVADSNEEWLRAGSNLSEVSELSKMTIKVSEIAGSNIKDTTSQAIALKNAYEMSNGELKKTFDGVVKMDNTSATSTDRLLRSLLVVSSSAKQAKVPVEWLLASLTTVQSKSKQTSESIGKNFRNIFLNMTKMTSGKDQIGLNKTEDQLNKINIAMRINKDTFKSGDKILDELAKKWNTLTEVQQAQFGASIAGKENINSFNILMQNQTETIKNLIAVKNSQGSVDKAYEEHLISTKGALNELKATLEHLYMAMISGNGLKNIINDLTKVVQFVEFLITDGKELTKVWIAMLIAVKNFKLVEMGIMGCVTAFKYLTIIGLEAVTLLEFNPIILGLTAISVGVVLITKNLYEHSQKVKSLKADYVELNEVVNGRIGDKSKESIEYLKKEQIELKRLIELKNKSKTPDGGGVRAVGSVAISNTDKAEKDLKNFTSNLKEAGVVFDEVTAK